MVKEKRKYDKATLVVAIFALIISIGVPASKTVFENELKDYYVCELLGTDDVPVIMEFARLSGSQERGYPYTDSNKGYKDCKLGTVREKWVPLAEYAEAIGLDPYDLMEGKTVEPSEPVAPSTMTWGKQYKCNAKECVEI